MLVALLCLSFVCCAQGSTSRCATGMWFNRSLNTCMQCSDCPPNEIIRRTCSRHKDTVCGPFSEWDDSLTVSVTKNKSRLAFVNMNYDEKDVPEMDDIDQARRFDKDDGPLDLSKSTMYHMVSSDGENKWKVVSFCLMAILVVVLLAVAAFGILKVTRRNRKQTDDPVYLRTRIFSRDRLSSSDYVRYLSDMDIELGPQQYFRKKRLQRLFKPGKGGDFRDEVFDASDESIYKSVNNGKFRLPAIPEEVLEREIASKLCDLVKAQNSSKTDEARSVDSHESCDCQGACSCTDNSVVNTLASSNGPVDV